MRPRCFCEKIWIHSDKSCGSWGLKDSKSRCKIVKKGPSSLYAAFKKHKNLAPIFSSFLCNLFSVGSTNFIARSWIFLELWTEMYQQQFIILRYYETWSFIISVLLKTSPDITQTHFAWSAKFRGYSSKIGVSITKRPPKMSFHESGTKLISKICTNLFPISLKRIPKWSIAASCIKIWAATLLLRLIFSSSSDLESHKSNNSDIINNKIQ